MLAFDHKWVCFVLGQCDRARLHEFYKKWLSAIFNCADFFAKHRVSACIATYMCVIHTV